MHESLATASSKCYVQFLCCTCSVDDGMVIRLSIINCVINRRISVEQQLFMLLAIYIRPILLYWSDAWGIRRQGNDMVDKVFYCFIWCALGVKATTSNLMVWGESGQMLPGMFSHINVIYYPKRLHHLPSRMIVKQMYIELCRLHECGFVTWITKAQEVMQYYGIQLGEQCPTVFKQYCKQTMKDTFVNYVRNPKFF